MRTVYGKGKWVGKDAGKQGDVVNDAVKGRSVGMDAENQDS